MAATLTLRLSVFLCGVILWPTCALSQYIPSGEFGDPTQRLRSSIDGNHVKTSIYNFGLSGRTGVGEGLPYEWPAGTGRHYLALVGMFVGGEVQNAFGQTIQIVSVPSYRHDPFTGNDWNFNPVPGYRNSGSGSIARSDDPSTWPPFWPDKLYDSTDPGWAGAWNGLRGRNAFIGGTEFYHHYSDDRYARHPFFPDSTNLARRGLGIVVSERVLAWNDPLLDDALITVADIWNTGMHDITHAALTFWVADLVGGDGDTQDDRAYYSLQHKSVYFTDADGFSPNPAFAGNRVGVAALAFLQTPRNSGDVPLGITNMSLLPAGFIDFSTIPDDFLWSTFMIPGQFYDPGNIPPGENDVFASCGLFSLQAQTSQRVVTAIVLGDDTVDVARKIRYAGAFVNGGYSAATALVSIITPVPGEVVAGQVPVHWNAENDNSSLRVDILFSGNDGDTWKVAAEQEPNDGVYLWNTDSLSDGIFYRLRIVAYDSTHLGYATLDSPFVLNNPQPAPPQVRILAPSGGQTIESTDHIRWVGGDPDGDAASVSLLYYSPETLSWSQITSVLPATGEYAWNSIALPNSPLYRLRAEITDGTLLGADTVFFVLRNARFGLHDSSFVQRATIGTGPIDVHIVDSTLITGHTYRLSFSGFPSSVVTYDVVDENTGLTVVNDAGQVDGSIEGPLFDGIRLLVRNDSLRVNGTASGWSRAGIHPYLFELFRSGFTQGTPELADYSLGVGSTGLDTSRTIVVNGNSIPSRVVNFTVLNKHTGQRVPFGFLERDGTDGHFTANPASLLSDIVILLTPNAQDSLVPSWSVRMQPSVALGNPLEGDTLSVSLFKPFAAGDEFRFTAVTGALLAVRENTPGAFTLEQNFPNPFNPSTTIRFSLERPAPVRLEVFDLLGRRVCSLVDGSMQPGVHEIVWNGTNSDGQAVSSGLYLYRMMAGSFVVCRKMLIVR